MGNVETVEPSTDQGPPFPPWWMALFTACVISVLVLVALFLSSLRENISESERSEQNLGILLMVIALLPAWLSCFFTSHRHDLRGAAAYCLGIALCVVGLAIAA